MFSYFIQKFYFYQTMDIILHNVSNQHLPLIQELAKALNISMEKAVGTDKENAKQIKAALDRVQSGKAQVTDIDWETFRKMAYGEETTSA